MRSPLYLNVWDILFGLLDREFLGAFLQESHIFRALDTLGQVNFIRVP